MHKQALAEDGAFNFAFAGDNGIKQGETIHPDGTRNGAYSYVDPNGETISVKYTAGKDGFKILQGDHIPRPSIVSPQIASLHGMASNNKYSSPFIIRNSAAASSSSDELEDLGFGPTGSYSHYRGKINPNFKSVYRVHEENSAEYTPQIIPYSKIRQDSSAESHNGPHTFGNGYSFEFGHNR